MKKRALTCLKCGSGPDRFIRHGQFYRKSDGQILQRFRCKTCGSTISQATFDTCFGQKRRKLNYQIYKQLNSGTSQRRAAKILNCNRKTVVRKFIFMASKAKDFHKDYLQNLEPVTEFQFDDVETFEHSKCKPLSITLAVDGQRRILGFRVSEIAAKGHLTEMARKKYGARPSNRKEMRDDLFQELKKHTTNNCVIRSDMDPHYPPSIKKFFPESEHITTRGRRGCVTAQGELKKGGFDPIFNLNHTAAMLRANINRLIRRTWCTTKLKENLERHLWLYMVFHNTELIQPVRPPTG